MEGMSPLHNWRYKPLFWIISMISLTGLAILILSYSSTHHKLELDKTGKQVYAVGALLGQPGQSASEVASPPPLANVLTQEFQEEVKAVTRILPEGFSVGRYEGKVFHENHIFRADEAFFEVFDVEMKAGDQDNALTQPYSVVMTRSSSERYFGPNPRLGQQLHLNHQPYTLTAIIDDMTPCAPLQFDMLLSMSTHQAVDLNENWSWHIMDTYLRLNEEISPVDLEEQLPLVVEKYARPQLGENFDRWLGRGGQLSFFLQAV